MEKKDYLSLKNKYSFLADYEERYRQELIDFIHEAFGKHGNEFEYKCDTHATWQEKNEDEEVEFDAMNDLPVCVTVWVDDDGGHEVYPTVIRQYSDDIGHKNLEVDGFDYTDSSWVKYQQVSSSIEELQSVAFFINAVLEQEQESKYPRKFKKNEQVAVSEIYGEGFLAIVELEQHADNGDDTIDLYPIGEDGKCGLPPRQVKAKYVYQKAEGKVCPGCGSPLYVECNTGEFDYAFYCPECQGNFFCNEVQ